MKGNTLTEATSASLSPDNPTVAAAENDQPKEQVFQNDLHRLQFTELERMIKEKNALVAKANAANGDRLTLTETIRDTSQDPEIVRLREQISELIMQLDALVNPLVDQAIAESSGDINAIEEGIKELDKTLKPGLSYFKNVYGDEAYSFFSKQDRLKGLQLRSGSGGRRIRGYSLTVTVDGEDRTFENFSTAAKYIGVDTVDLQRAFFDKAGTEDAAKLPSEVKFVVNYTEVDDDKNETEKSAMVHAFKDEENNDNGDADVAGNSEPEEAPEPAEVTAEDLSDL